MTTSYTTRGALSTPVYYLCPRPYPSHMDGMEEIRKRLLEYMDRRNFSVREMAEEIGVSHATISHIRNQKRIPSPDTLQKLAPVLAVDLDTLLEWAGHRQATTSPLPEPSAAELLERAMVALRREQQARQIAEEEYPFEVLAVLGEHSAGQKRGGSEGEQHIYWKPRRAKKLPGNRIASVVRGDCLDPDIKDGWHIIIDPDVSWQPGKHMIALRANGGHHVKKLIAIEEDRLILESKEGRFEVNDDDTRIEGVVVAAYREFDW